ncbi:hypothetical protein emb_1d0303 [Coriobacteriaceae bacterium EMTCatB1]|nr:hypothetical protein emb_1d0303 [Coriobacteriaceae bacterium EMTCatB1]
MKQPLAKLKRLDPRTVWPSEPRDFTPWLAENIGMLGEVLGTDLEVTATEQSVGDFSLDILAKDLSTGDAVVIENQYGSTDHDHLGKLLTYASGVEASMLVWIAQQIRDEHRQALEWLNERTDSSTSFFAIALKVLQIGDSPPAVNLNPIVFPNKWQKATRRASQSPTPRGQAYQRFFQGLTDELRERHKFTKSHIAQPQNWASFASGVSGITYAAVFAQGDRVRVELYIDQGDAQRNKEIFDGLLLKQHEIEKELGEELSWERLDDKRASRIAVYRDGSIEADEQTLAELHKWMIEQLLAFKRVFTPYLKELTA